MVLDILAVSDFSLQFSLLNCVLFPFHCESPLPQIWCFLLTQDYFIPFSLSLFSKMFFWLYVLSFPFEFCLFILFFFSIRHKDLLLQKKSLLSGISVLSSHSFSPSGEEKKVLNIGFLIRNQGLLPAGSLVKISLILSTPFPREQQWMEVSPAHPTLFKLSFALSVKSWHPGDSRTCTEFNPGEPRINITWLFLPISCSLSIPDVEWGLCYSLSWPLLRWPS